MSKDKRFKSSIDHLSDVENRQVVAVQYDLDKDKAPKIIAVGKGGVADEILKIAEDNRIPLFEDPTLADLLSKLDLNREIPGALFPLVAEVLAFVYQLDRMAKKREGLRRHFKKS